MRRVTPTPAIAASTAASAVVTANRTRTGAIISTFVPGFRNGHAGLGAVRKSCEMHGSVTSEFGVSGTP
jgi:hypothetical protein